MKELEAAGKPCESLFLCVYYLILIIFIHLSFIYSAILFNSNDADKFMR